MSTPKSLIEACRARGVSLTADGTRLIFSPLSAMTADLAAQLRTHKAAILNEIEGLPSDLRQTLMISSSDAPHQGRLAARGPQLPCWWCGCVSFARDLADHGWVCVRCHPPGELRAHVTRNRISNPTRTGGAR